MGGTVHDLDAARATMFTAKTARLDAVETLPAVPT